MEYVYDRNEISAEGGYLVYKTSQSMYSHIEIDDALSRSMVEHYQDNSFSIDNRSSSAA